MSAIEIRLRPSTLTSVIVRFAAGDMHIEAVGVSEGANADRAADLRAVAGALMRYADRLDPVFVEALASNVEIKTVRIADLAGLVVEALRAKEP